MLYFLARGDCAFVPVCKGKKIRKKMEKMEKMEKVWKSVEKCGKIGKGPEKPRNKTFLSNFVKQ